MKKLFRSISNSGVLGYGLFWAWNLIFLAFMLLGFAPLILPSLLIGAQANIVPVSFAATALLLIFIPIVAVILGATVLRREPGKLFALGYAVEGPLMLLVAIRLFVVREMTTLMAFVFVIAALGMLAFFWQLLDRKIDQRGAAATTVRVAGLTLFAIVALYAAVWLAFYAIPLAGALVNGVVQLFVHIDDLMRSLWLAVLDFPRNLAFIPFAVFGMLTFAFSATLFVLMPIAVPILVLRAWQNALRNFFTRFGKAPAAILTMATAAACIALFLVLNQQPQQTAFALLEAGSTQPAQAQQLAAQEETIRAGLLNAYLAPQRYVSSVGEVQHIRQMYNSVFGLREADFIGLERVYEVVAAPLLYKPVGEAVENAGQNDGALNRESRKAAELYEAYFDETIFDGERATVLTALGSTWDVQGAQQAVQDADDRQVHLQRQDINVVEHGDWAEFELHEEYQNQSGTRQEVVYYITMPESAVITGVWLGDSDNRDERAVYRVSPRGAAQQAYRQEVRRNIDPALVEQIGPRQYRVRVFPIEPKALDYQRDDFGFQSVSVDEGPPLHLWLTWREMASNNGWTLPYLAEKRNVHWDNKTVRTLNGQPYTPALVRTDTDQNVIGTIPQDTPRNDTGEAWLPPILPATTAITRATHRFDLPDGETVIAQPIDATALPGLPNDSSIAVVVDRSRSMRALGPEVQSALAEFKTIAERGNAVDVYLTASKLRGEPARRVAINDLDPNTLTYFGGQNPAELVQQFGQLRGADAYNAIFVLTDGTGYALGTETAKPGPGATDAKAASNGGALWFVHLGGSFPLGYDDPTLQKIQSTGGGVTGSLRDALERYAAALAIQRGDSFAATGDSLNTDYVDDYLWLTLPASEAKARFAGVTSDEAFAPFAARRLILTNVQRERASLEKLNTLDELHALAKQYSVVTPYSSMIVLVNEAQQQTLDELEKQGNRFDREVEEVGQTTMPFDVTAVPEPHEYLLMALGAGLVVWYLRKKRQRAAV